MRPTSLWPRRPASPAPRGRGAVPLARQDCFNSVSRPRLRWRASAMRRAVRLILPVLVLLSCGAGFAYAQSEGTLRGRIGSAKAREGSLSAAIARLSRLEAATQKDITVLEGRVADVQAQLATAEAKARAAAVAL